MTEHLEEISILVVEDDRSLLQMVTALLQGEGYDVHGAENGEAAIEMARETTFDLVITDVKLGKLDGLDTLSELKKSESTFQSLVMTGYSTEEDTIRALKLGVGNYLKKPFSLDDFLLAVQEQVKLAVLERKVQARETAALKTLCWALETVLHLEETPESGLLTSESAAVLAERAALVLGLPKRQVWGVKAVTLLHLLKQMGAMPWEDSALDGFPPPVPQLLADLKSNPSESSETHLVRAAMTLRTLEQNLESVQQALAEELPDLPEEICGAIESALADDWLGGAGAGDSRRSLLSLASALRAGGDREGASLALAGLRSKTVNRDNILAHLLQARLEWDKRNVEQARDTIESALEKARGLGRRDLAQTLLAGGLLLVEMGQPGAADMLMQSRETLEALGAQDELASLELGLLACGAGDEEKLVPSLSELMQARYLERFLNSGPWLLPYLLSRPSDESSPTLGRAVHRLIRDLPELVRNQAKAGLPIPSLKAALQAIASVGKQGHEETLQWLLQSSPEREIRAAAQRILLGKSNESLPPVLRIYLTGPFETWLGDSKLKWSGTKYPNLLGYICSGNGPSVALDGLLEVFWPDHGKRAGHCFSQALSIIKRTLQPAKWERKLAYIDRTTGGVGVNPELPVWSDLQEIRRAMKEAGELEQQGRLKESMAAIRRANQTYRGPLLAGCYMDWALARREELIRTLNESTLKLAGRSLESQLHYEALGEAEEVLKRDSTNEQAQSIKMQALARTGRASEAVRSYESFCRNLKHELELEPSTDLIRAYHLAKMEA